MRCMRAVEHIIIIIIISSSSISIISIIITDVQYSM